MSAANRQFRVEPLHALRLGAWNSAINLFIAVAKGLLVAIYFMDLRRASPMLRIAEVTALLALGLLFGLNGTDYSTRTIHVSPWQAPAGPQDAGAAGASGRQLSGAAVGAPCDAGRC
ncbi:cytochrome c oxidase subunit 4 [Paraburkholderia sp. RAU6.4a]|uniref:cytochrome C oxidase subunit IV family protein n=1 Tax=Paraburkholderia sp. UCT31 TaxID=2615209 RepID=UPI00165624DD|nr:cytochrome C oxidase subunit IV family protein [Paraburkholderia sp. UCT31]MBC8720614.1 hypothetical protein [Paraburkholderia sp. 31.1]MBC8739469.1 hypothetical protein [Paraburkholderia sp. UCT31]